MAGKAPGKSYRKGLTLLQIADMFSDEKASKHWIAEQRWPKGAYCPHCGSFNVQCWIKHPSQTHRCRDCESNPMFSVKTGTVMEGSNLKYRVWAVGIYLFTTNIKGISSMKLHRELGIGQKAAWFMLSRLRKAYEQDIGLFSGPVEVDEVYMGGKERNKHSKKKQRAGRGPVGKTPVAGIKDRTTGQITAKVVKNTDAATLQGFVTDHTEEGSTVYSDDATVYHGLKNRTHESVKHSVGEYVRDMAHTNGIESFWAMLRRGHQGIYHKMSAKQLDRYVAEFAGRHNARDRDTISQMSSVVDGMQGKRLRYRELIADNGLPPGSRT